MQFGCCISMLASQADPLGLTAVGILAETGFDYVEVSLRDVAALGNRKAAEVKAEIEAAGMKCRACNNFFPAEIRLTGPEAEMTRTMEYAARALDCAKELGAEVVVFGSSEARNVPAGFSLGEAGKQLLELLKRLGPLAAERTITIVIEPLNKVESNIINTTLEGLQLAREVGHPNVQLLVDFYHLAVGGERPEVVREAGSAIRHVHFSRPQGRAFPTEWADEYDEFLGNLARIGYNGRFSIEAYTADLASDARRSLRRLKEHVFI